MASSNSSAAASLRAATAQLSAVSDTARLDAEILMAHALGLSRADMLMRQHDLAVPDSFAGFIERRAAAEPVAYIRGQQEFWDLTLTVTPDVLIPRGDSETLIEAAIKAFDGRAGPMRILDLGTGSGALLLAALSVFPEARGVGIDASSPALAVAADNANRLGFGERAEFRHLSWCEAGWSAGLGQFDLILCNPPYIEDGTALDATVVLYEPLSALFAGPVGLNDYRILIPQISALCAAGGVAIFEIGHTQAEDVSELASKTGLLTEMRRDLAGKPRCLRFSLGINQAHG